MADWYKHIPNWLTFLRLILIPVFVLTLIDPARDTLNISLVIFIFAALTDYADGMIARRYAAVTDFGKIFDPLADKILVMSALVMLVGLRDDRCVSFVPAWMVVMILAREFWITSLRAIAAAQGTILPAKSGGKVKSLLQMVSIMMLLLHDYPVYVLDYRLTWQLLGLNLLLLSIFISYISAVEYTIDIFLPDLKGEGKTSGIVGYFLKKLGF